MALKSPRLHPLNWGDENGKKLIPPHPKRFQHVNLNVMREKVFDSEHIVSEKVLQLVSFKFNYFFILINNFLMFLRKELQFIMCLNKVCVLKFKIKIIHTVFGFQK